MTGGHGRHAPLRPGGRVRIVPTHHWAQGARGTLDSSRSWRRTVEARGETIVFHWVRFDEVQHDAAGDGPYAAAEIDARYLESID